MFDGVIFDMDGLMVDTEPVWMECWEPALAHFGYAVPPGLAEAVRGSAGDTASRIIHEMVSPQLDTKAFWAYFSSLAEEIFAKGVEKKPGLDELLAFLGERGVPCAVASSSSKQGIERNLRFIGALDRFEAVVPSSEVAHAKPAPDVFLEAARRLGTEPARTMVLEDSFNGVRAGAAGGFFTVMVPDLARPDDEIRACARACSRFATFSPKGRWASRARTTRSYTTTLPSRSGGILSWLAFTARSASSAPLRQTRKRVCFKAPVAAASRWRCPTCTRSRTCSSRTASMSWSPLLIPLETSTYDGATCATTSCGPRMRARKAGKTRETFLEFLSKNALLTRNEHHIEFIINCR